MSHYTVAVFCKPDQNVADLLALYNENLEVDPYLWLDKQSAIEYARKHYRTENKTNDECWEMMARGHETDEKGNIYSTYNPNSKWDWWTEGGRWSGSMKIGGYEVDSGRVGDIDFSSDEDEYQEALEFWDGYVEGKDEEHNSFFTPEYYKNRYRDRETYARTVAQFMTYAVVTPDGKWHAPGEIGWFACSTESDEEWADWSNHYKERFIDAADPDWILTMVDCHI